MFLFLGGLILILAACTPQVGELPGNGVGPTPAATEQTPSATGLPPAAVLEAQKYLAEQLGVPIEQAQIGEIEQVDWSDSCLGLGGPAESCAQVITPGWRATFVVNGQAYEVRTDETGSAVRLATPAAPDSLANIQWELVSYGALGAETPVLEPGQITLAFEAGGRAGGSAGCNTYGGSYQVKGDTISFSAVTSTLMACADDGVMDQEQRYLQALESASRFALTETGLTIWYDDGQAALQFTQP